MRSNVVSTVTTVYTATVLVVFFFWLKIDCKILMENKVYNTFIGRKVKRRKKLEELSTLWSCRVHINVEIIMLAWQFSPSKDV